MPLLGFCKLIIIFVDRIDVRISLVLHRVMCNYEESEDSLTEAKEILLAGSQQKENFSCNLNSVLLGKLVSEIWGEKVKLVRRGPCKDWRSWYLNLRPKDPKNYEVPQEIAEMFQQFRESSTELVGGWNKISDHPNTVSFIRYESWSFNNQRVSIEFKLTLLQKFVTPSFLTVVKVTLRT